jgi:hypothetical protein
VNCVSSLEGYIKSAEATGVTEEEILEIAKLAKFIKGRADSHVDRQITALGAGNSSAMMPAVRYDQ